LEFAVSVKKREAIAADVPFRMAAGAFLNITGKSSVPKFTEGLANRL
jgi:hypothetical protein